MSIFRRRPLATAAASDESASPADKLQAEISALEGEMAESIQALADVHARVAAAEVRAMEAIRAGDDRAARASLVGMQADAERAASIAADLKVLRAILDECREFAKAANASASRPEP